mgnify:CR=1 FL=1
MTPCDYFYVGRDGVQACQVPIEATCPDLNVGVAYVLHGTVVAISWTFRSIDCAALLLDQCHHCLNSYYRLVPLYRYLHTKEAISAYISTLSSLKFCLDH